MKDREMVRKQSGTGKAGRRGRSAESLWESFRPSQDALKLTACAVMLLDHIGGGILEQLPPDRFSNPAVYLWAADVDLVLRLIGRISFPIFAWLLVQGVVHTSSLPRYAFRLFVFALISELPFDLLFFQRPTGLHQNIFWTLLLGVLALWAVRSLVETKDRTEERAEGRAGNRTPGPASFPGAASSRPFFRPDLLRILAAAAITGAAMGMAALLHTDYSWKGILLITLLYFLRRNRAAQCLLTPAVYLGAEFLSLLLRGYTADFALGVFGQHVTVCLSFAGIFFSSPVRKKGHRYAFYAFYPLHLSLLYLVRRVLF